MQPPRALGLPYDDWRPGQRRAIRAILNASTPHIIVCAPTGSGKSGIAAALAPLAPSRRVVILTGTLALQDVYASFPTLTDLRGARHYPCLAAREEFASWFSPKHRPFVKADEGPCHLDVPCALKSEGCPYFDAKRAFSTSMAASTTYAMWLSHRRINQPLGHADLLACDEAHALPEQLMQACRVDIPYALLDSHRIPQGWRQWVAWASERLEHQDTRPLTIDLEGLSHERLTRSLKLLAGMDDSWAWDEDAEGFHFEPTVPQSLLPLLTSMEGASQVAYLSATITPSLLRMMGVSDTDLTYHELPSTFDPAKRPVYFVSAPRGNYKSMKSTDNIAWWVDAIDDACAARDDRRGLIQPVSYQRAALLASLSSQRHRMVVHQRGTSTAEIVRQFRAAGPTAILVSPAITTGYDFAYEDAEFNILAKLPFPNTSSHIMKARCRATARYSDHYTAQTFVQSAGRIVRADDDQGETIVCDGDVQWWYPRAVDLMASWFTDAVVQTSRRVTPLPKLAARH